MNLRTTLIGAQGEYDRLQRDEALRLNREENRLSGRIYTDKHNGVKPPQ